MRQRSSSLAAVFFNCLLAVWLADERNVLAQSCNSHAVAQEQQCDDGRRCTVDFADSVTLRCKHLPVECRACKQHGSNGNAVDFVLLLPASAFHNGSFVDTLGDSLGSLLSKVQRNGLSARLAVVAFDADKPPEIVLGWTISGEGLAIALSSYFPKRTWPLPSRLRPVASVGDALLAISAVWSNSSFQDTIADSGDDGTGTTTLACEAGLGMRHVADLHVVMVLGGATISPSSEPDVTRALNSLITIAMENEKKEKRNHLALTIFIDDVLAQPAVDVFGSPQFDRAYIDKSHFNMAATLKGLMRGGTNQASCLQAHLLSKGVYCRNFDIAKVSDNYVLRSLHRTSLEPSPVYCSECQQASCSEKTGCVRQKLQCPIDSYCSPVLGCVRKNASSDGVQAQPLISFRDVYTSTSWKETMNATHIPIYDWPPTKRFVTDLIAGGRPVVLRHTAASKWPALNKWNDDFFREALPELLIDVKRTSTRLTFDPDRNATMSRLEGITLEPPYSMHNMSRDEFLGLLDNETVGHYYFTGLPDNLKTDLTNARFPFAEDRDFKLRRHFLWMSSRGMVTHTHFDQGYNFFVQLSGILSFTLWPAEDHEQMYMYPRIHPMWHKSQVDPANPDYDRFPLFSRARPWRADLVPGDLLYIPPYTWHHVVSQTQSVSVSSYSHDYDVRTHMNAVYRHDHKFDLIASKRGKMFVLRLYLDTIITELYGKGETNVFFAKLLATRYRGLERAFPVRADHPRLCRGKQGSRKIPTAKHIYDYATLDMRIIAPHFQALAPVVKDVLFTDYVEEMSARVVGVEDIYAFFRFCFREQEYYSTQIDEEEHSLWDHAEEGKLGRNLTDPRQKREEEEREKEIEKGSRER